MKFSSNQVVVVTGASSGVGRALALACAKAGASLALVGRNRASLEAVVQEASASAGAGTIRYYLADLTCDADLSRFPQQILADFGRVDGLIHSAALLVREEIKTATLADLDAQFSCNVRAPYAITQSLLPSLLANRGAVVFINSSAGLDAKPGMSQYSATKHALKAIADCLRQEMAGTGLRVLSLFLGRTATPMQEALCLSEGKPYVPSLYLRPEDVAQAVLATLDLPASAEITDLTLRPLS